MPGIDRQRVVGKTDEELNELTCRLCQHLFDNPVVTLCCGQTYCSNCINEWLIKLNTCPNDSKKLSITQLTPAPKVLFNLLSILSIKCQFHSNGCEVVMKANKIRDHSDKCQHNPKNDCDSCVDKQQIARNRSKTYL